MEAPALDPEIARFVDLLRDRWAQYPPLSGVSPSKARRIADLVRAPFASGGPAMASITERRLCLADGALKIRVYDPGLAHPAPLMLYFHGGGFMMCSLDTHDRLMREYAAAGRFLVVGVDYPLAPEARYPVALDRSVGLVDWLLAGGAESIGGDPARMAAGGDSAGGNLSLALALRLRDRGQPDVLSCLLLNYGGFTGRCSDAAEARFGGPGSVMDRAEVEFFLSNYLGDGRVHIDDPYACPIAADFAGLPPAFLVIPECDILSEQSHAVAAGIRAAGGQADDKVYPGAAHSFLEAMSMAGIAREAVADGANWVAQWLAPNKQGTNDR
ncbi:hypothetical protein B2G71_14265 [Novosphingobium sp. PC22D]|uniref:alpha/beta hydrolase n=1 Tax=Novosphingobium sp. PC22D TaxID=1962403 RepID=UPI000BF01603|nr:alpha/beta hydrolase [Novosphingobium sp. PC22D]PEQ11944.1 hypothetical protein B2G71_14265 [Novosphingobium sp. PC22D]